MSKGGERGIPLPPGDEGATAKKKRGRKPKAEAAPKFRFLSDSTGKSQNAAAARDVGGSLFGKGGKTGKEGKASLANQPLELRLENELPENCKCLMDCEAASILEGIQDQMAVLSSDTTIKIPVSFSKGLHYAKSRNHYTNSESVRHLLDILKEHGVSEGEICEIANVCPENTEEVFALVPSLKAKRGVIIEPLRMAIDGLSKLKKS